MDRAYKADAHEDAKAEIIRHAPEHDGGRGERAGGQHAHAGHHEESGAAQLVAQPAGDHAGAGHAIVRGTQQDALHWLVPLRPRRIVRL